MDAAHLRIAISTQSGAEANFASATQVVFFDVARDDSEFVDCVRFRPEKGLGGAYGRCAMEGHGDRLCCDLEGGPAPTIEIIGIAQENQVVPLINVSRQIIILPLSCGPRKNVP